VDAEQDDDHGGQGDGEQAAGGQVGAGLVVAEDEAGHGPEAGQG
jgi:hypothetical protein